MLACILSVHPYACILKQAYATMRVATTVPALPAEMWAIIFAFLPYKQQLMHLSCELRGWLWIQKIEMHAASKLNAQLFARNLAKYRPPCVQLNLNGKKLGASDAVALSPIIAAGTSLASVRRPV